MTQEEAGWGGGVAGSQGCLVHQGCWGGQVGLGLLPAPPYSHPLLGVPPTPKMRLVL